jgi:hypothetical protein
VLFAGLFGSVLVGVPAHLGGIGSGVLIALRQSGPALSIGILLAGGAIRRRFTRASAGTLVIEG